MTEQLAIATQGLVKRFGQRTVVDNLELAVPTGSIYGFLGPNGSGKTTTVRMLLGLATPTAGSIEIMGKPIPKEQGRVLPQVGAMVEGPAFYPWLSGRQNLKRFAAIGAGRSTVKIDEALEIVGLSHAAEKKFRAYSLGMRQRLALANALMFRRDLLILDEPTNGLDPQGTREVRNLIRRFSEEGTTVFLSSHLLSEIDQVCTHAVVLTAGKTVAQGPIDELRQGRDNRVRVETPDVDRAAELLQASDRFGHVTVERRATGDGWLDVDLGSAQSEEVASLLVRGDVRLRSMVNVRPTLEEAFVALTGEGFDVAE